MEAVRKKRNENNRKKINHHRVQSYTEGKRRTI